MAAYLVLACTIVAVALLLPLLARAQTDKRRAKPVNLTARPQPGQQERGAPRDQARDAAAGGSEERQTR